MLMNVNEYHENDRMLRILEDQPRQPFLDSVRAYAGATNGNQQVRLIEAIIRTSRAVANDNEPMHEDIRQTLCALMKRYRALGNVGSAVPSTYHDARSMIKSLFF